ncbi:MAG: hypothetical protein IJI22_00330 [Bacilli bacterium]|nr:hypothetical protein [Bacilli bacterium]
MNKRYLKYILLFVYYYVCMIAVYFVFRMDTYNNYGFSYGIVTGSIPYKDFNPIVPLFGPFLYSTFLLFNHSILLFYLEQSVLLLVMDYLLFKILDEKAWIVIVMLFLPVIVPFAYCMFPGYNFLIIFELILLLYFDKYNKSDKLVGLVSGISVITKHNIGVFIFLVSLLFVVKDKKKLVTRFLYGIIPGIIFIIILLLYGNLYEFIDLCLLGVSDFIGNKNIDILPIMVVLISLMIMIIKFIKDQNKDISYFYLLVYILVVFPIFDIYHICLFLLFYIVVWLYNSDFTIKNKHLGLISFGLITVFINLYLLLSWNNYQKFEPYSYDNYEVVLLEKKEKKNIDQLNKYLKHKDYSIISDPSKTIFLLSSNNKKADNFLVLFRGNYGSKGKDKILKEIKIKKNYYFVVDTSITCRGKKHCQYLEEIPEYVMKNLKLVKEIDYYKIYYKN